MFMERLVSPLPKFFFSPDGPVGDSLVLTGENAAHARVLRLRPGDAVTVCDARGTDYACTVRSVSAEEVLLDVCSGAASAAEPRVSCSVYVAFPKADKLEHIIQKATELGACEIVAFPSSRCVSRPDDRSLQKKLERWQKIAASAAEQSGRGRIPQVLVMDSYAAAIERAARAELALFPYENEQSCGLRAAIGSARFTTASIVTGPEGGFSPQEVALAQENNMKICSLGPRILRCETAPLCALSALLFASGDLDL